MEYEHDWIMIGGVPVETSTVQKRQGAIMYMRYMIQLSSQFLSVFFALVNGRTTSGHTFSTISIVGTVLGIFLGGMLVGIIALVLFRRIRPVHQPTKPSSDIEPSGVELEDRTYSDTCTSTGKGRAGIRYIDSLGGSEQKDAPDLPPIKQEYLDNNAVMVTRSAPLTDNPAYGSLPVYEAHSQDAFLPAQGDYSEATYGEIHDPEPPADLTAAQVVAQHEVLYKLSINWSSFDSICFMCILEHSVLATNIKVLLKSKFRHLFSFH